MFYPDQDSVRHIIDVALAEDIGKGDLTSEAIVNESDTLKLVMTNREDLVVAGIKIAEQIFQRLAPDSKIECLVDDADKLSEGTIMMTIEGTAGGILTAERTALNMVQFLSGIATETRRYVEAIAGTQAILLDTRKTVPGLRILSKYASKIGGATNHRMCLDDGILIKDNHIALVGSVSKAVKIAQRSGLLNIEVECDSLQQVREALDAGANKILLDNMCIQDLRKAVQFCDGQVSLEASGGVNLINIRAIAETGVDYISVGRLTQSAPSVDIGLDLAN